MSFIGQIYFVTNFVFVKLQACPLLPTPCFVTSPFFFQTQTFKMSVFRGEVPLTGDVFCIHVTDLTLARYSFFFFPFFFLSHFLHIVCVLTLVIQLSTKDWQAIYETYFVSFFFSFSGGVVQQAPKLEIVVVGY